MSEQPNPITVAELDAWLVHADQAAQAGHAERALELAQRVLLHAQQGDWQLHRARALSCLANYELRLVGGFRRSFEQARLAAFIFQQLGDTAGEAATLGVLAIAASRLGQQEDAIESGLLAVRLAETLPTAQGRTVALLCFAIACYFARSFDEAEQTLLQALQVAQAAEPPLPTFHLQLNRAVNEAFRWFNERNLGGARGSLDRLVERVDALPDLMPGVPADGSLVAASQWNNAVIVIFVSTMRCVWSGDLAGARQAQQRLTQLPDSIRLGWLGSIVAAWGDTELAIAEADWPGAAHQAQRMIDVALRFEHEAYACWGHQLAAYVFEQQGRPADAVQALRSMALREQRARSESLKSRARVVEWQMELRQNKQNVHRLELSNRQLEQLAMQDALTGLANRRRFESQLSEWLRLPAAGGDGLCLALIDVDRFKAINDGYSHATGDAVLAAIASILQANLRDRDLPARLAGDEFVVVLRGVDAPQAQQAAERLRHAVARHDWSRVAAGLRVSISIGMAQAVEGDTEAALLARADEAMYADKRQSAARA